MKPLSKDLQIGQRLVYRSKLRPGANSFHVIVSRWTSDQGWAFGGENDGGVSDNIFDTHEQWDVAPAE